MDDVPNWLGENNVPLVQQPAVRVECRENSVTSRGAVGTENVVSLGLETSGMVGSEGMADMDLERAVKNWTE